MPEHGFYHPERGYWQAVSDVPQYILETYPEGTVEIPLKPGDHYYWNGSDWVYMPPDPAELLEQERAGMVCSRFQAKAALHAAGLLNQVEAALSEDDAFAQLAWAEASEFRRTSPTMLSLAESLGMTDEQLDDLFRAAMAIEA